MLYDLAATPSVPYSDWVRLLALLRKKKVRTPVLRLTALTPALAEPAWRVPAKIREKIDRPKSRTGEAPPAGKQFEIAVLPGVNGFYADGAEHMGEALLDVLDAHSLERRDPKDPRKLSTLPVLVLADGARSWRHVQSVLSRCVEVRLPRVWLAVETGGKPAVIRTWLPTGEAPAGTAFLTVRLDPGEKNATTVTMKGQVLGAGPEGMKKLGETLAAIRKRFPDRVIHGQIVIDDVVPYRDVVAAVDEYRAIGVRELRFIPK
jgi:biopolymer transport protein ExbD